MTARTRKSRRPIVHCVVTLEGGQGVSDEDREALAERVERLLCEDERLELLYGQLQGFNTIVEVEHQ